jgi:hypothetical protein
MNNSKWPEWRLAPCGTAAASRRHWRHGDPPCYTCRRADAERRGGNPYNRVAGLADAMPDPRPVRNGIPWRPYVYRGTGADAFTGEVVTL